MISRLFAGLQYPLSTLHERRCRRPCKTRFRPAGSAFTGRASNPLGHDERFQVTSFLLSRAYPDASWSHLRREFFDITKSAPAPLADEVLKRIAALYAIEAEIRGRSADERRTVRQDRTKLLVADLKTWFENQLGRLSGKSVLAGAIRYGLNHWPGLVRFLDDGRIEMDTNTVERAMRPIVLSRKNALFAGHDRGAENWAVVASLIETCKLHAVNPEAYLGDVLTKLVQGWPQRRLADLMPWAWAAAQALAA